MAFSVVLAVTASLAACSPAAPEEDTAACTPTESGEASDSVKATGDFGTKPTVEIDDPLTAETTERSVLIDGDGDVAESGFEVTAEFTVFNGTSGEEIDSTDYADAPVVWTLDETLIAGFVKTLECSTAGSRVAGVIAPADGIAEAGLASLGLTADDSLVVVADVLSVEEAVDLQSQALPKADGADQPLPEGFPGVTVTIADDATGTPTITVPGGDAPTETQVAVLKKGDGTEVRADSNIIINYAGVDWATGEEFDSSWTNGAPIPGSASGFIEGFTQALVGQTVGSQIVAIIPPASAYGLSSEGSTNELADKTLVFVFDILAAD
jgi:peptidylprolyl isomerase